MANTILEVIQELKAYKQGSSTNKLIKNWSDEIHPDSKWYPGSKADPHCKSCEGMGYVRLDLPIGHRYFGKVFECECVVRMMASRNQYG